MPAFPKKLNFSGKTTKPGKKLKVPHESKQPGDYEEF